MGHEPFQDPVTIPEHERNIRYWAEFINIFQLENKAFLLDPARPAWKLRKVERNLQLILEYSNEVKNAQNQIEKIRQQRPS